MNKPVIFKLAFFIALLTASFLFLQQGGHSGVSFEHADKVAHFLIFFSLTLLFDLSFKLPVINNILILSFYGALIEILQSFLPYRSASFADFIADFLGVVAYLILLRKYVSQINSQTEIQ